MSGRWFAGNLSPIEGDLFLFLPNHREKKDYGNDQFLMTTQIHKPQ